MADDDATPGRTAGGTARKAPARKAPATKATTAAKSTAAKSTAAKSTAAKSTAAKSTGAKKAATPAKRSPVKKPAAKRTAAKSTAARTAGQILTPRKKAPPRLRLAAEDTFDDDWEPPAPAPVREDPAARIRAVLRAAAQSIEAKERSAPRTPTPKAAVRDAPRPDPIDPDTWGPPIAPSRPRPPDEPVTRVLVSPPTPEPELEEEDEDLWQIEDGDADLEEEDEDEEEDDDDWAPPEVLDDSEPPPAAPPPPPPPPPAWSPPTRVITAPPRPVDHVDGEKAGRGAGLSIVAMLLALVVPLVGAIAGLVMSGRAKRRGAALAGVARVVSVLALVGWVIALAAIAFANLRDEGVDYSKLKVGDCFASSASNEVRGVKVEPCSEPHNSEIFFVVTHPAGPGDPYPGKDALVQFAADACLGQPLTEYLGIPLEKSKLKDFEIVPQESAWKDGRRVLVCGIDTGGQGDLTGSVKGTRQ